MCEEEGARLRTAEIWKKGTPSETLWSHPIIKELVDLYDQVSRIAQSSESVTPEPSGASPLGEEIRNWVNPITFRNL